MIKNIISFILVSLILHALVLLPSHTLTHEIVEQESPINITSIRTVGEEQGSTENNVYLKPKSSSSSSSISQRIGQLNLKDLSDIKNSKPLNSKGALSNAQKVLKMEKDELDSMYKNTNSISRQLNQNFSKNDIGVQFDIPKGVKQDELNEFELKFYSFRVRTATKYVQNFLQQLQNFERQNPHISFPMTKDEQEMTGRITYDEKGNIVRIQMVKWSEIKNLQGFFLELMQKLNSIPNPPEEMVQNGEFTIYYTLKINGQRI